MIENHTPDQGTGTAEGKSNLSFRARLPMIATICLCVLLIPIILYNVVMSVQSLVNPDKYPTMFGAAPLLVNSEIAEPDIQSGDMIFGNVVSPEEINPDDVIMYFDTNLQNKGKVQIQKVTQVIDHGNGEYTFLTTVINPSDKAAGSTFTVPDDNLIARYEGARIPLLGAVLGFMGSITGVLVCVGVPLLAVIGYMIYKGMKKSKETDDLKAELERLRQEKAAQAEDTPPASEASPAIEETPGEQAGGDGEG